MNEHAASGGAPRRLIPSNSGSGATRGEGSQESAPTTPTHVKCLEGLALDSEPPFRNQLHLLILAFGDPAAALQTCSVGSAQAINVAEGLFWQYFFLGRDRVLTAVDSSTRGPCWQLMLLVCSDSSFFSEGLTGSL